MPFACSLVLQMNRVHDGSPFITAAGIQEVARAAESAGFDSVAVTDHPCPTKEWMDSGGHHALDPWVALAVAAGATTRLRLLTYIYVLPYRNPFLTAKGVASLDVVSGGRVLFGVAVGYLEEEFRALGVPFAERNRLADEALRTMRTVWRGGVFEIEGRPHVVEPRPIQQPVPVWVGGNSRDAIRRAVTLGDGWMPIYNPPRFAARRRTPAMEGPDDLRRRLGFARRVAEETGRTRPLAVVWTAIGLREFGTAAFPAAKFLDDLQTLRTAGVTYFTINLPGRTPAEQADLAARFGQDVIARL